MGDKALTKTRALTVTPPLIFKSQIGSLPPCPGIFTDISCKFTREYHYTNPLMCEIIHIQIRGVVFRTQVHIAKIPAMELEVIGCTCCALTGSHKSGIIEIIYNFNVKSVSYISGGTDSQLLRVSET